MEFGCGTGLLTMALAPELEHITAVDSSSGMLEVLEGKIQELEYKNISTRFLDFEKDGFPTAEFDLIFSAMVFHHVESTENLLKGLLSALKPGGILAVADLEKEDGSFHGDMPQVYHHGFAPDELGKLWEEAGFCDVRHTQAHIIERPEGSFPVFLMSGRKK